MNNIITVTDGIINSEVFKEEKIKLLWILKEPNDQQSKEDWSMCDFLRYRSKEKEGLFNVPHWHASFGLICKISWGVLEDSLKFDDIENFEYDKLTSILDRVALINVKKIAGGSRVNNYFFEEYIKDGKYLEVLKKQIREEIQPTIIICGYTFNYLAPIIKNFDPNFDMKYSWKYIDENDIIWINGYHPNQTKITHKEYFEIIREIIREK